MRELFGAIAAALGLNEAALGGVGMFTALGVATLAALSTMLGHVAILLLNRISGLRLVTTLLLNLAGLALLHTFQAFMTWSLVSLFVSRPLPLMPIITVGLLSLAPHLFAFLTAIPHIGLGIGRALEIWAFIIVWLAVPVVYGMGRWWALAATIGGWLAVQLVSRLLQRPINWLGSHAWTLATGRPTMITSRDILAGMPIMPVGERRRALP